MRLIWALQAEADLYEIADQYTAIAPALGEAMLDRILEAPRVLLDHPYLGQSAGAFGLRKWSARRTPFILLYRVTDTTIEIARIVAAASDWIED